MTTVNDSSSLFLTFGSTSGGGGGSTTIIDNLDSDSSSSALSARQGKILKSLIDDHDKKIASTTALGHVMVDGTSITIDNSGKISAVTSTIDIVDNLTTNDSTKVLSAKQGKVLKDELEAHKNTVASKTDYGHVKIDGISIVLNNDGTISAVGGGTVKSVNGESPDENGNIELEIPKVVNDLTTGGTEDALSAEQGKLFKIEYDSHVKEIASSTKLGHVKIDDNTIKIDTDGVISVDLDNEGNLRKEELVFENFAEGQTKITFTPQIVAEPFVELVYDNTTKIRPSEYTMTDDGVGNYTITFAEPLKTTDMINITLLSGLATGSEGEPLIKESFRFDNLATDSQQGITIPFSPSEVSETFIDFVYINTTKLEESSYVINKLGDNPLEYELVIDNTIEIDSNTMVNLVLVDGKGFGQGGSSVDLHHVVDETDDKAVTPKAVKDYVDSLEGELKKNSYELRPTTQGQLEFNMPSVYDPSKHIDILFFNSIKVLESRYSILEKVVGDPTQGYKLVLLDPAPDYLSAVYNLLLISGVAIGNGGGGTSDVELHYTVDETNDKAVTPKAVLDFVEGLDSTLTSDQRFIPVVENQDVVLIDNPDYNPDDFILMLFENTIKVPEKDYIIRESSTSGSGYEVLLNTPLPDDGNIEIVLIYGRSVAKGRVDVSKYIYEGSTPPSNTSMLWLEE